MVKEKEIKKMEEEIRRLRKLVYFDDLTEILNRRGFKEEAGKIFDALSFKKSEVERRIGKDIPFSVIFLDIDNFKSVNDNYGHDAGDKVLKNIAKIIEKRARRTDIYSRWGGEEFVVALPGANIKNAQNVAESLRKNIEKMKIDIADNKKLNVTISLGIVDYHNETTLDDMLTKADKAMYEAKQKGKNRVEIFIHS